MKLHLRPGHAFLAAFLALLFLGSAAVAETETETQSQTYTGTGTGYSQSSLAFTLVPSPVQGAINYTEGNGTAFIQADGTNLYVHVHADDMARGARFSLVMMVNGVPHSLANMTTDDDGGVEGEASVSLSPGTYSLGIRVLDVSTFTSPTVVLTSSPGSSTLTLTQSVSQTTIQGSQQPQSVSTFQGGETEDNEINGAIQSRFIPAVVDLGGSGPSVQVNDGRFSVSVGTFQQDGFVISISASNVTGPRVVAVNLTQSAARTLFSGNVVVTLDGAQVQQASTVAQVLGAKAGDPALFAVLSRGSSAFTFLISIPHFSYHAIDIFPIISQAARALVLDLPVILFSLAAVTIVITIAYDRRSRLAI